MANILALNPYHGGSHRAFLEGWCNVSRHTIDVLSLPAYKWKWRMRHAAITLADQLAETPSSDQKWDVVWSTDMLNVAEFRGLVTPAIRALPMVLYFHENQLTYPTQHDKERDLHYAFTNLVSALAADQVWFNSEFHRQEFLTALDSWMKRMPDFQPTHAAREIEQKSAVLYPGIDTASLRPTGRRGPLTIAWVARWEHDKGPETFFAALRMLHAADVEFRICVMGESFGERPACFDEAQQEFAEQIDQWGHVESRASYLDMLSKADVVVSTAKHEFFGIGVLEAVAHGCWPVVPARLAYPEVLGDDRRYFHDGTAAGLAKRLQELAAETSADEVPASLMSRVQQYDWDHSGARLDDAIAILARPAATPK